MSVTLTEKIVSELYDSDNPTILLFVHRQKQEKVNNKTLSIVFAYAVNVGIKA